MVVERSNALVYLITSALELKVEGSNPRHVMRSFLSAKIVGQEWRMRSSFVSTAHARNLNFRNKEREIGVLGGFRRAYTNMHV